MRVRTHLVAMPWASPDAPSIQLGCLSAHLRSLRPRADCRVYSAFFSILHELGGRAFGKRYVAAARYGEFTFQALYLRRFGPPAARGRRAFLRLVKALREPGSQPPTRALLDGLERATRSYLDTRVGPALLARGLNLVGFTLNYDQVYASLYAAEHLRRRFPDRRFLFVYGGSTPGFPSVYRLLCKLGVPGVVVLGEGERKLELLVRSLEALPPGGEGDAAAAVAGLDPGVIRIGDEVDLGARDPSRHRQVESLGDLSLPDYDEYFASLREACADRRTFEAFRAATTILVEGTRGCFGRCDFCAQNRSWDGFRKRTAEEVFRDTLTLTRRYHTAHVQFADSVCDTWARRYARMVVEARLYQRSFMDLRAHHPEELWTLLALAGVEDIQIGVEALSAPLLRAMGKGATAVQNLAAHKALCELGIHPSNNLMTHHPASTLGDVRETRRILRDIPHWRPFQLTRFRLQAGSPLYEGLTPAERARLRPTRYFHLPSAASRLVCEFTDELPRSLHPGRRVMQAWSAFKRAYERTMACPESERPRLDVVRVAADRLHVTDTREGALRCSEISGDAARIYDACHRGLNAGQLALVTGLAPAAVRTELGRLRRRRLVLEVDGSWLALALRPRDELLRRLAAAGAAAGAAARPAETPPALAGRLAVVP